MAISEACKFEIKEEVDQMVDRGDASTKSQAFDAMVEFYKTIGIEIKCSTVKRKYYRAQKVTNVTNVEPPTTTSDSEEIKEIKRQPAKDGTMRGGPRPGAGRKPNNPKPQDDPPVRKGIKKHDSKPETPESMKITPEFNDAYEIFLKQIVNAKNEKWQRTTKAAVARCIETINYYLEG